MPLITNLPAASSLSASDLLIKDTGSTTQKLAVSNAYASASQPGFVSTGAQTFAGVKTFEANTINLNSSIAYPGLMIHNPASSNRFGGFRFNLGAATPDRTYAYIEQASLSGGVPTGFYENYYFPRTDDGLTASISYQVLTTKEHQISTSKRFTIPANGSITLTFTGTAQGSARGIAVTNGGTANQRGMYIVYQGGSVKAVTAASVITASYSGSTITFASTATTTTYLDVMLFNGYVTN